MCITVSDWSNSEKKSWTIIFHLTFNNEVNISKPKRFEWKVTVREMEKKEILTCQQI